MTRRWIIRAALGLVAFLTLPSAPGAQLRTVKVACTSKVVLDNLPLFVGMRMKFFEEAGIKLEPDRKSTRLNSSHSRASRMPSSA